MADDYSHRPYRQSEPSSYRREERQDGASSSGANDPLAELARLIGQDDPFGEYGSRNAQAQRPPARTGGYDERDNPPSYNQPGDRQPYAGGVQANNRGQLPGYLTDRAREASSQGQNAYQDAAYQGAYDDASYDQSMGPYDPEDRHFYDEEESMPHRGRRGIVVIAGIFALAVLGTVGAFGYRAIFGGSSATHSPPIIKADSSPAKIVPANTGKDLQSKLINDRVNDRGQGEKIVSREEQPIDLRGQSPGAANGARSGNDSSAPALGSGVVGSEPKKIHTIAIRPDGTIAPSATPAEAVPPPQPVKPTVAVRPALAAAERETPPAPVERAPPVAPPTQRAAPAVSASTNANAPLSLNPNAASSQRPAPPVRTAAVTPTQAAPAQVAPAATAGSAYAVQLTSQRSEADAQTALRSLQSKYAAQLGGQRSFIYKVDLGAKGTYYRGMVGPFTNSSTAGELCSSLKAAGGQCIVQKN